MIVRRSFSAGLLLFLAACSGTPPESDVVVVETPPVQTPPIGPHTSITPAHIAELDEPPELVMPLGELKINNECFYVPKRKPKKPMIMHGKTKSAPRPEPAMSAPSMAPSAPSDFGGLAAVGGVGGGDARGGAGIGSNGIGTTGLGSKGASSSGGSDAGASAPAPTSSPPAPPPAQDPIGSAPPALPGVMDESGPAMEQAKKVEEQVSADWGATIWLSNDDSMSLASAQRALYALKRGVALKASEIRPHELLNYFSFATQAPAPGELFGVRGDAVQTGETFTLALAVQGANPPRQPLDLTLLVDRSCSMRAEDRMGYTQKGLTLLSDNLEKGDRLDLVLFDSGVCAPVENFVVGRDDTKVLLDAIRKIKPTSSTNLDAGLNKAWKLQASREDVTGRNRRVVLITDANLNAGNVDEDLVSEVGKRYDEDGIRLSGIGVGRKFNDTMLDKLTEKGKGAYVYLGSDAVVERVFGPGFDSLTRTIAHDVRFALDLPDTLALERFYGEEASTDPTEVQPINYYADTSQLFLQDLKIKPGGTNPRDLVALEMHWKDTQTGEDRLQRWESSVGALLDSDKRNVHKAQALMSWTDALLAKAMGGECGDSVDSYKQRADKISDDAEINYVSGLLAKHCGVTIPTKAAPPVSYKVKVDSDAPISEVHLVCAGVRNVKALGGGMTVASFSVPPGECTVRLMQGNKEMSATATVPATGGDLTCRVRAGKLGCS